MKLLLSMLAGILLVTPAWAQDKQELPLPPSMDQVTVNWDKEAVTGHTVTLHWSEQFPEPPGVVVKRYRVWRSLTKGVGFKIRTTTSRGATSYVDNAMSGKTYWYRITSIDANTGVESDPSIEVAVTVP